MDSHTAESVNHNPLGVDKEEPQRSNATRAHADKVGGQESAKAAETKARRRKCQETTQRAMRKELPDTGTSCRNDGNVVYSRAARRAQNAGLLDARCATLHRLYSLPAWDDLTEEEQEKSLRAIYEVCRVTAIIYCNAVILPIPINNGWNDRHTARLVELLTTANFEKWHIEVSELHVWALLIGGVAAQSTAQRPFFENALKRWYAAHRRSWSAITTSLKEFIWSDRACKVAGATLLHHALFGSSAEI